MDETFRVNCSPGEVMQILGAEYGHMKVGKCVERDIGVSGCKADVSNILGRRCEGKQNCEVSVLDDELKNTKPCSRGIYVYLEASHACLKGKSLSIP